MEKFLDYFVPERYVLDILIDKKAKKMDGVVRIFGEVKAEVVKLHAVEMKIESVKNDGKKVDFNYDGKTLELNLPKGSVNIEIKYSTALNENMEGAYLSTYSYNGKTETIVATQFESHYAREAFPCVDEPAAKAVFELSIAADEDDMILSNMPELKFNSGPRPSGPSPWADGANSRAAALRNAPNQTLASGHKTVSFEPTPRMSTYLLAWVVGKFHGKAIVNAHGVEITTYAALNQDIDSVDFANEVAARSLEFYDDKFGVPYPLKKCTQVALPDFEAGAMENWGLVTYRESMLLAGKNATLGTKKSVALTVAHELSHQWFGDLVTMEWWDDLWLNESFASVMEYFAVDAVYPEFKIWEGFFTGDCLLALKRDCMKGVQSVHQEVNDPEEIATLFDSAIVYSKGARLMLMVIRLMGWENFRVGIKEYFEKYQYGNTKGDGLWGVLTKYAKFDVGEMMHGFIDRPGYPVIKNIGVDFDKISQKRFLLDGKMPESDWTLPGVREDMSGHYVLDLSEEEFEERLSRFDDLELEEKLRLLIDRDLLARTELVQSASLIPLVKKFQNESSAAVWNIILTIIGGLKIFYDHDSKEEKEFKKFVRKLVEPKLAEIGIKTRSGDDENIVRLRSILLALDFYAEDEKNLRALADMYNEDYESLDSEIRENILSAKIYLEPNMAEEYLNNYETVTDPEIKFELLAAMTLMKDKKKLLEIMKLLNQPEVVKPQDQLYLFIYLYRNPVVKERVFEWLTKNWEYVRDLAGDKSLENYPRYTANSVRTEAEFLSWQEFFEPMRDDLALRRAIEVGENEIRARLKLIKSDQVAVVRSISNVVVNNS